MAELVWDNGPRRPEPPTVYADACAKECAYGTCNAPGSTLGCGGCCGCLGGCQVAYEESLPQPFQWPCSKREAHGPHQIERRDWAVEGDLWKVSCPGVRAHPDTMIGRQQH